MHQCRPALQSLYEIGQDGVLEKKGHGTRGLEVGRGDRLPIAGEPYDDPADPRLEVGEIGGKSENRHDLAAGHDHEPFLPHRARVDAAEADDHGTQRPVVHVHRAGPGDAPGV